MDLDSVDDQHTHDEEDSVVMRCAEADVIDGGFEGPGHVTFSRA